MWKLQPADSLGSLSKESVENSLISQMRYCLPLLERAIIDE